MVAAAGPLSQLAGVIAGFVFAGIIVLLSQPRPHVASAEQQTGSARLRALIPFFATFVAMGLNAYVFGLLAGEEGTGSCRRVWTATAVASGMLAIGTVAAVSGIILLVRAYLARDHLSETDRPPLGHLERMLVITIRLLAIVATGLLWQRIYEFLIVWYGESLHGMGWLWLPAVVVGLGAVALVPGVLRAADRALSYDRVLSFAGVCTVFYSIAGTALVGLFLGVSPDWQSAPPFVPWTVAAIVATVPFAAIVGYVYAIRGFLRLADHRGEA